MKTKTRSITAAAALLMMMPMLHARDAFGNGAHADGAHGVIAETPSEPIAAAESSSVSSEASGSDEIVVFKLAGDGQKAPAGQWTPASLEVGVWKENGLKPLINVPVDFSVPEGSGWLARTPGGDIGNPVQILTDIDGIAQVWHRQPDLANLQSLITASALGRSVTFTTYSIAPVETPRPSVNMNGSNAVASTDAPANPASETAAPPSPARLSKKSLLVSLATAGRNARAGDSQSGKRRAAGQALSKGASAEGSNLPDDYFSYPADHPIGQMQRGMLLYAAAGKARELRDTEQAGVLAGESEAWLALALEGGTGLENAHASRCHYYLGKIAECYKGNQAAALTHYRAASGKDPARKQAKTAAERVEYIIK